MRCSLNMALYPTFDLKPPTHTNWFEEHKPQVLEATPKRETGATVCAQVCLQSLSANEQIQGFVFFCLFNKGK